MAIPHRTHISIQLQLKRVSPSGATRMQSNSGLSWRTQTWNPDLGRDHGSCPGDLGMGVSEIRLWPLPLPQVQLCDFGQVTPLFWTSISSSSFLFLL